MYQSYAVNVCYVPQSTQDYYEGIHLFSIWLLLIDMKVPQQNIKKSQN